MIERTKNTFAYEKDGTAIIIGICRSIKQATVAICTENIIKSLHIKKLDANTYMFCFNTNIQTEQKADFDRIVFETTKYIISLGLTNDEQDTIFLETMKYLDKFKAF